ncbi:hypothetical protein C2857_003645 [Epichloe festucae Fl1]|uniref:Uncharacterized protein n=1 Tax=Epichloe festucae (strain Fl1) TaxID=877507 RepID=A0A7S9PSC3_EPIFF|nr:hypothetical protein C2857_003645 [Epichloe festucae Fl1]
MAMIATSGTSTDVATGAMSGVLNSAGATSLVKSIATSLDSTTPTTTATNPTLVLTTYSPTTYMLPTLTSWGTAPDGLSEYNLAERVLQLITSGSNGERIVRGFLIGVAMGIILGGALCCWVPCFGRRRQERRERRRQQRRQQRRRAERRAWRESRQSDGAVSTAEPAASQQEPGQIQTSI